jgi:hypothetical protein
VIADGGTDHRSRVKAWLDVYVLRTEPHFYWPAVEVRIAAKSRLASHPAKEISLLIASHPEF